MNEKAPLASDEATGLAPSENVASVEITLDMNSAGVSAYKEFDPENEELECLVAEIIYHAFKIARRNSVIISTFHAGLFPPVELDPENLSDNGSRA
jgi:hypothetical protein